MNFLYFESSSLKYFSWSHIFKFFQFDTPTLSARELNEPIEESESDVPSVYYNENLNYIGHCVTEVCFKLMISKNLLSSSIAIS